MENSFKGKLAALYGKQGESSDARETIVGMNNIRFKIPNLCFQRLYRRKVVPLHQEIINLTTSRLQRLALLSHKRQLMIREIILISADFKNLHFLALIKSFNLKYGTEKQA